MKSILKYIIYFIFLICISCTNDKTTPTPANGSKPLPDTVLFSKDILPIFINNCDNSGCHAGVIPSNRINLDSISAYSQLMKTGSGYVDTINPPNSVIYVSVISVSNPMPPSGKLDNYYIQLLLKWIQQGAKNN